MEELEELKDLHENTYLSKVKKVIFSSLKKNGFITVLLLASVPNPLFDLAGILCGHFLIPFKTFFGATVIGKAVIKV